MNTAVAKKLSFVVNAILFVFVLMLLGFFYTCNATFLVYFSIPTIAVYLVNFLLIKFNKLDVFVWLTYSWIELYMGITTICLGFDMGFHLYSISMILVIFCTEYMAFKLNGRKTRSIIISVGIALVYICCTGITLWNGPIYETPKSYSVLALTINACIVFSFLIIYSKMLLDLVISSEKKLTKIALYDKLTGLYNRHYIMDILGGDTNEKGSWIAILDIDNFKKINDTYGHSAGDDVLIDISKVLNETCKNCTISRWGGEEFLILCSDKSVDISVLENMRNEVSKRKVSFEDKEISYTVTVGVSIYDGIKSVDKWIIDADEKLYYGKNNGKNKVVSVIE